MRSSAAVVLRSYLPPLSLVAVLAVLLVAAWLAWTA